MTYEPKWKGGTFKTQDLKDRMGALLGVVQAMANTERVVGSTHIADELDELVEVVTEYSRLMENGRIAYLGSIKDGVWVKDGKEYKEYPG